MICITKVYTRILQRLEETLLTYLNEWKEWITNNTDIPDGSKKMCLLPDQTIEGLQMCGKFIFRELIDFIFSNILLIAHSLNEVVKFLLSHGMEFVLTERFNQDTVKIVFTQQRSQGGRSDNPSVAQFLHNTQALIVQKSLALGGSSEGK